MSHSHGVVREKLAAQLEYFREEKTAFLDRYAAGYGKPRVELDQLLSLYCAELTRILDRWDDRIARSLVLIGSRVTLRYPEDGSLETYTIVFPDQARPELRAISMLSPLGRQLLLAKADERLQLMVPSGELEAVVVAIDYRDEEADSTLSEVR